MAKLRHIAIMVPNPGQTAKFFIGTFGMEQVGTTESPLSTGVFLSDGTVIDVSAHGWLGSKL